MMSKMRFKRGLGIIESDSCHRSRHAPLGRKVMAGHFVLLWPIIGGGKHGDKDADEEETCAHTYVHHEPSRRHPHMLGVMAVTDHGYCST